MAGTNQAVNLSGMLSQMANSIGTPTNISSLTSNIEGATQPRLDPNDPDSLERYAKWAESTGKRQEAAEYRSQAAKLRRERSTMKRVESATQSAVMGRTSATQGDVEGVQRQIAQLQQQLGKADTLQEQQVIRSEMRALEATLPDAQRVQQSNKVAGVMKLEELLSSGSLSPEQAAQVEDRKAMLMQQPEIAAEVNKAKVTQAVQQKQLIGMEADKYVDQNRSAIMTAINDKDEGALAALLEAAPEGGAGKVQAAINSYASTAGMAERWRKEREAMSQPLDVSLPEETYADLPDAFKKPITAAYESAAAFQKANFKNGQWVSEAARVRGREMENKANSLANAMTFQFAQQAASRAYNADVKKEAEIQSLQLSLDEPIADVDVMRRARMRQKVNRKGEAEPLTQQDYTDARMELEEERREAVMARLEALGEVVEQGEEAEEAAPEGALSEKEALDYLKNNNTAENRKYFKETYGYEPDLQSSFDRFMSTALIDPSRARKKLKDQSYFDRGN